MGFERRSQSRDELSIGVLVRLTGFDDPVDAEAMKLIQAVRNNNPTLLAEMTSMSSVGGKQYLRERFGSAEAVNNLGVSGWSAVQFGPEAERLIGRLCVWFAQTAYLKHVGVRFTGEVIWTRFHTEHLGLEAVQQLLLNLFGQPVVMRNGNDLSGQFFYRFFAQDGIFIAIMQFTRRPQFVFVVCALAEEHIKPETEVPGFWQRSDIIGHQPVQQR